MSGGGGIVGSETRAFSIVPVEPGGRSIRRGSFYTNIIIVVVVIVVVINFFLLLCPGQKDFPHSALAPAALGTLSTQTPPWPSCCCCCCPSVLRIVVMIVVVVSTPIPCVVVLPRIIVMAIIK